MRKFTFFIFALGISANMVFAGGIITNTNQSASYIRMPSRNASLEIDAVYYNPAGLTRLDEGLHISVNNQFINQTRTITNNLSSLNRNEFTGDVKIPVFPGVYAAYKSGNLAFSFGVNPAGGGGMAEYIDGLPSIESGISRLVPTLDRFGVTEYRSDLYFKGSSVYPGGQLGVSYELFGMVSFFGGGRFVMASNRYEGYIRDIQVNTPEGWMRPGTYLTEFVVPSLTGLQRTIVLGMASSVNQATADADIDVKQRGYAITPVVGLSIVPGERFNIGLKYEFPTRLELENETVTDGTGMFPDGRKSRSDLPALLSAGVAYQATPELNVSGSMHYYFDKDADYGRMVNGVPVTNSDVINSNFFEAAIGLEYTLTNYLRLSAGYLRTQSGVNNSFNTDISHSLSTNNVGGGARIAVNEVIAVNLGFMMTFYVEDSRSFIYESASVTETYNRDNMVFALGVDLKF
ncbi:MAG: OmpP1/FadL family transporter [Bacteroidales bacterium]